MAARTTKHRFHAGQPVRLRGGETTYTIRGIDPPTAERPSYHLADQAGFIGLHVAIKDQRLLVDATTPTKNTAAPRFRIETIEQAIQVALTIHRSWFRGHSRRHRALVPGIFRPVWSDTYKALVPDYEASIYRSFRRKAPALLDRVPSDSDDEAWLFVMQHHGSPTRLLDWTENALAALYFAVSEEFDRAGELWALYPPALNKASGIDGLPPSAHPIRRFLAASSQHPDPSNLATLLSLDSPPQNPIAIAPVLGFPRMVAQRSAFTLHPPPLQGHTIVDLLPDKRYLVRYDIPADAKGHLLQDLRVLGVTRATLFPDLDALSDSIIDEHLWVGYSVPEPPKW